MRYWLFFLLLGGVAHAHWDEVLAPARFVAPKSFPLRAYSEFMPPPRGAIRPYELRAHSRKTLLADDLLSRYRDPASPRDFLVDEKEENEILAPGLNHLAAHWLSDLHRESPKFPGDPVVSLSALVLAETQDDRGRIRWTVFGGAPAESERLFAESLPRGGEREWLREFLADAFAAGAETKIAWLTELEAEWMQGLRWRSGVPEILITFRPEKEWPADLRRAYRSGKMKVVPTPATLLLDGVPLSTRLARADPSAAQIPLARAFTGYADSSPLRIPKVHPLSFPQSWRAWSGPLADTGDDAERPRPRFAKSHANGQTDEKVSAFELIFLPTPRVVGLYGKPIARNTQVWGTDGEIEGEWLLSGPAATEKEIAAARDRLSAAARGEGKRPRAEYRDYYPPLEILGARFEWYRPLVTYRRTGKTTVRTELRGEIVGTAPERSWRFRPRFARHAPATVKSADGAPLTYALTVTGNPDFEKSYWNKIAALTDGKYRHKNNVDCADADRKAGDCTANDLLTLAKDFLARHYAELGIATHEHAVNWDTDFRFDWWGGKRERHVNLIAVIPGKRHDEAVIMADHYDTAYMEDVFHASGDGKRVAAAGADDNHSGTSALMEAAPVLRELSRRGKLERDVWLVHLTGEEFPADCLGARALAQALVEGRSILGSTNPRIVGAFVLDMVAHNTDRDRAGGGPHPSVFQISPGRGARSRALAELAAGAARAWNGGAGREGEGWNAVLRRKAGWERSKTSAPPAHPMLLPIFDAQIRAPQNPDSALYNTDGQIFSDVGIPTVLFMENYDINRKGYHDSLDTLANIDLDFGAGVSRIAIEAVARAAARRD